MQFAIFFFSNLFWWSHSCLQIKAQAPAMSPLKKGRIWLRIIAKRNTLVDEMIVLSRFKSQYIMRRHHQRKHGVKGECGECGKKVANLGRAPHPSHVGYNSVYESCTKSCFAEPLPSGSEFLRIRLLRWFAGLPSIMEIGKALKRCAKFFCQ